LAQAHAQVPAAVSSEPTAWAGQRTSRPPSKVKVSRPVCGSNLKPRLAAELPGLLMDHQVLRQVGLALGDQGLELRIGRSALVGPAEETLEP
jgi:hypothetical protein